MYDFPNSPAVNQVFGNYTWDGEKWLLSLNPPTGAVRFDAAQVLTVNQQAQARANIGQMKKNYIINGAMTVSQENGTTAGTVPTNPSYWPVDTFQVTQSSMAGVVTAQQVASATPAGSPNRCRVTVTTSETVSAAKILWVETRIEGLRAADLRFGTPSAKTVTIQFGVKAPAGTYCVAILNAATNRSYVAEYVISAGQANTDTLQAIVIPGDVTGTWAADNTIGITIRWGLMVGTTYQQAAGSWGTVNAVGSSNQFNFMGTNGNVFELFDVGLYEGTVAPLFMVPDYASELLECQRYYYKRLTGMSGYNVAPGYVFDWPMHPVQMRAAPTVASAGGTPNNVLAGITCDNSTVFGFRTVYQVAATGFSNVDNNQLTANARL